MIYSAYVTYSVTSHVMLPVEAETEKEAEIIARRICMANILDDVEGRSVFPPETRVTGSMPDIEKVEIINPASVCAKEESARA